MINFLDQPLTDDKFKSDAIEKRNFALQEKIRIEEKYDTNYDKKIHLTDTTAEDVRKALEKYKGKYADIPKFQTEGSRKSIDVEKISQQAEDKMRQWLWESSPELKELRQKILMADVTRDQAMQIAENQALEELKRQEEKALAIAVEEEKKKFEEEMKRKEQLEFVAKQQYHKDLDELVKYKATRKEVTEDQAKREKETIDEIRRQIEEEDEERERKRIQAQRELHRQALELQKVRQDIKILEKMKEKNVDSKADEYRKAQELRFKSLEEKKLLDLESKLHLQEELLSRLEKIYKEKAKQEQLWTELSIEEREASEKVKMVAKENRERKIREELQNIYDMQMLVKKQKEEQQKKEDELFRQNLMTKLFEEEKLENMSQQKRRVKQAEHGRIAQKLLEEERQRKAKEREKDVSHYQAQLDEEAKRLSLVEEERKKFLEKHAKQLLGYLPKGVFRNMNEIELLGKDFKKFYSRRNCSSVFQSD